MAKNEIFRDANHITLPVDADVESGDLVVFGSGAQTGLSGVAQIDADEDGEATIWLTGAWELPVADATYAVGDAIYAHAVGGTAPVSGETAGVIDKTSTTGVFIGHALEAKTTTGGTGTLVVRLKP